MLLPQIRLVLGTTYRDLHAEREYLLKRTIPQVKRQCEEQGILFTLREMKWSEEPVMIARQMNRFLEVLADQDTYYLGIRSDLRPPAPNFSTVSTVSSETALRLEALLARKASWREIEEDLVAQALGPERIILLTPSELIGARKTGYIPEELGATIEAQLQSVIDIRSIRERAKADHLDASPLESYHKLYLRSRAEGALQSASKADDLIRALGTTQQVVLLGVTGSGKSTTIALALEALTASGESVIPYVFDGADNSAQGVAEHILASIQDPSVVASEGTSKIALALSRAGQRIIALDGIEFLDQESRYLGWFPHPLPTNIQLVASTADEEQATFLEANGWKVIEVSALRKDNITALIDHLCWERDLWLTPEQRELIERHPLSFHPQFLITLIDELGQFGWFAQLNKNLDEYLDEMSIYQLFNNAKTDSESHTSLPNSFILSARLQHYLQSYSLVELYGKVLERLEFDFGTPQLTRVLGYLLSSTRGLTLDDLAALTGLTKNSVQHMLNAMDPNITSRNHRLLIGNDHFGSAIAKRYLATQSVKTAVRTSLIQYLRSQGGEAHVLELASQYVNAGARQELRMMLLQHPTFSQLGASLQLDRLASLWNVVNPDGGVDQEYLAFLGSYQAITPIVQRIAHLRLAADLLLYLARPAAAKLLLDAAITASEGSSDLDVGRAYLLRSLGRTLYSLSRYQESEAAYRASVEVFRSLGPSFGSETLASRKALAQLLAEGARYPEADAMYSDILKDTENIFGAESPELASVLSSIGLMLNGQGKYDAAISVASRARNIFVHHWGREYPELGWCYFIFATAYRQKGDLEEAAQWYTQAIERFVQMHGEEHPIPLRSMYGRAVLLQKKGDFAEAAAQARKVVELRKKLLGDKHADTAAAKVLLGSILKARSEFTESMTLLSEGLEVFDAGANKEHPEVARTLHELGEVYGKLNMQDKAKSVLLRAVSIRSKVLGEDHPDTQASSALITSLNSSTGGTLPSTAKEKLSY